MGYCSSIETAEKCQAARALYNVGKSRTEIAAIMGCSYVTAGTYLNPEYRPKVVPTRACPVCGETFPAWRNQEHCSRECMMSLTAKVECVCKHCGKSFTIRESEMEKGLVGRGTYCSAVCYHKAISTRPGICPTCKRAFIPAQNREYCSSDCQGIARLPFYPVQIWSGHCEYCEKYFERKFYPDGTAPRFCSHSCVQLWRYENGQGACVSGEKHWNWKGGITSEGNRARKSYQYDKWQKAVFDRDSRTCQQCGATDTEVHAHHIFEFAQYAERRFDVANGITLCRSCHEETHMAKLP